MFTSLITEKHFGVLGVGLHCDCIQIFCYNQSHQRTEKFLIDLILCWKLTAKGNMVIHIDTIIE